MRIAELIDEVKREREDIMFLLSLVASADSLPVAEADRLVQARKRLQRRRAKLDAHLVALRELQNGLAKRSRFLSLALYIVAGANALQLATKSPLIGSWLSTAALVVVFLFAFFRVTPFPNWRRIVLTIMSPLLAIGIAAAVPSLRQFLNDQGNAITTLGVLYAVLFALVPAGSGIGQQSPPAYPGGRADAPSGSAEA